MTFAHTIHNDFLPVLSSKRSFTGSSGVSEVPIGLLSDSLKRLVLFGAKENLKRISQLPENWDGNGSAEPCQLSIQAASTLLDEFYLQVTNAKNTWANPHFSASEDGEITFEWWGQNSRKLTIYVGPKSAEYIRIWGTNIDTQMDSGELTPINFLRTWNWLYD